MLPGEKKAMRRWGAQKGLNNRIQLAVDAHGMPVRIIITEGTCADIRQTYPLAEGLRPKLVIADKAYNAKAFRNQLEEDDIQALFQRTSEVINHKKSIINNYIRYIRCAISLKIHFCIRRNGEPQQQDIPDERLLFWQSSRLAALLYIVKTYEDTT